MKKLILILSVMFLMGLTSCATADEVVYEEPSVDVAIKYGTPYYYNGVVVYYIYDNYYYYPRYNGTRWYYYRDRRPYWPHRNGWVNPGTRRPYKPHGNPHHGKPGIVKPNGGNHGGHHGGNHGIRPGSNRPNGNHGGHNGRPSTPRRR